MKLLSLKMAGFRGFREPFEIAIPPGFLIVTGRNGSGKSSVVDSIEYALTGKLNKYGDRREDQETVADYLWWKGHGKSSVGRYVGVGFVSSDGAERFIERKGDGSTNLPRSDYLKWFVRGSHYPADAVERLCRTRIIRDELITDLSIDISERERFEFVRNAVASFDFTDYERMLGDGVNIAKDEERRINTEYEGARRQISDALTQMSEIKGRIQAQGSLAISEHRLRQTLGVGEGSIGALIEIARERIKQMHTQLAHIEGHMTELQALEREREQLKVVERLNHSVIELEAKQKEMRELRDKLEADKKELNQIREVQQVTYNAFRMAESGLNVGLQDGCCPLCGSQIEVHDFESHVKRVLASAEVDARKISDLETAVDDQILKLKALKAKTDDLKSNINHFEHIERAYSEKKGESIDLFRDIVGPDLTQSSQVLSGQELAVSFTQLTSKSRSIITEVERLLIELETTTGIDKLAELEQYIEHQREKSRQLEVKINACRNVQAQMKAARAEVQRLAGEIVDERLAELSPLLQELYARIRPHGDWQELAYHVRGDVRRFLSLRIGENLNPTFMFSSGQRRAAGLAFLLAVNAASAWSSWNTLILDDPVQHIDDYRALHLVETLAALRVAGYQIICSVEDPELAKLLARRLRSDHFGEGAILTLKYEAGCGAAQYEYEYVTPLQSEALKFA